MPRSDTAGIPLTQAQEGKLVEALVAEQLSINQTLRTSRGVLEIQRTPEIRQQLLSAASLYLSTQQLDQYKALLERKAAMMEQLRPPEPRN